MHGECRGGAFLAAGDPERAASLLSELEDLDAPSALTAELLRGVEAARQSALDAAWSAIETRAWALAEERMETCATLWAGAAQVQDLRRQWAEARAASAGWTYDLSSAAHPPPAGAHVSGADARERDRWQHPVPIPAGEAIFGSPKGRGFDDERPRFRALLPGYYLGRDPTK